MSVVTRVGKAAGARVLTGTRPTTRIFPNAKWTLVVGLALLALVVFALISASQVPEADHYYSVGSKDYQAGAALVSEPGAAPQMSEDAALDAYRKLPLSFIPNEGQTDKAVRYYAQGAGYGFFFTKEGVTLSFSEGKGGAKGYEGQALASTF